MKGGVPTRLALILAFLACALAPGVAHAGTPTGDGDGGFSLTSVGDFDTPIDADNAPGHPKALFVAEKGGRILVLTNGVARTALDLRSRIESGGEQGLLAIAFHPGYRRNRLLYAYFTDRGGDNELMEFRAPRRTPLTFNPAGRLLLRTGHRFDDNHNGPLGCGLLCDPPETCAVFGGVESCVRACDPDEDNPCEQGTCDVSDDGLFVCVP